MKYTIGKFSEILGVTVDTLRLYDKRGIIDPIKNKKNNYRYFDDLDAKKVLLSRWYKSLRINLNDVADLVHNSSLPNIVQKIEKTRLDLEEKIRRDMFLLNKITEIQKEISEIKSNLYQFRIKYLPGIYRLKHTNCQMLLETPSKAEVSKWVNSFPYTFRCIRIKKESIFEEHSLNYTWGLAVLENELPLLDLKINNTIEYIRSQTYLSTILLVNESDKCFSKSSIQFVLDYLKENGYSLAGDVIGKLIVTETVGTSEQSYLELNMPVCNAKDSANESA